MGGIFLNNWYLPIINYKKKKKINKNIPTIPSTLGEELECNVFLRTDNIEIQKHLGINSGDPLKTFAKLRDLKDNF